MSGRQYPFWKDQQIAQASSEAARCRHELMQLKEKIKHITCPKCGYTFELE